MDFKELEKHIGFNVKVIFQDGVEIKRKEGLFSGYDETHLWLTIGEKVEGLLRLNIVRIEFKKEELV